MKLSVVIEVTLTTKAPSSQQSVASIADLRLISFYCIQLTRLSTTHRKCTSTAAAVTQRWSPKSVTQAISLIKTLQGCLLIQSKRSRKIWNRLRLHSTKTGLHWEACLAQEVLKAVAYLTFLFRIKALQPMEDTTDDLQLTYLSLAMT